MGDRKLNCEESGESSKLLGKKGESSGNRESTVREIIVDIYPELQPLLPTPLMESPESSDINKKLLAAIQQDKYQIFGETLNSNNPNPWYDEPYHSSLLEIACQMKNRIKFVEMLLNNGADPNITNRVTGMPLLHATAKSGNFEVLQLLLKVDGEGICKKDNKQRTILHWLAGVSESEQGDKEKIEECFKLLLELNHIRQKDIDDQDGWGNTPLYIAVERGFRDRAKLLLSKGADVRVFESGSKILLEDSISIVKELFDNGLKSNDEPLTSKKLQLKLDYESFKKIVPCVTESEFHSNLLAHPVMSAFLTLRWNKLRYLYLSYLAFYLVFLFVLTAYILCSEPHNTLNERGVANNTTDSFIFNDINITSDMNDSNVTSQLKRSEQFFLWLSLMGLLILLTVLEELQMIVHGWDYVQSPENWLEIVLIIFTFISCSGVLDGTEFKEHFSTLALFLGWVAFLLMSGRLPELSVQHKIFKTVSKSFLKFMAAFIPLLLAFAFSFYFIFKCSLKAHGIEHFLSPHLSLLKTLTMFSGELEVFDLTSHTLPYTRHVIFLLFVVLVTIILLNLLNVMAVNDTEEIGKVAETLSLQSRVRLLSRIEGVVNALPKRMKPDIELKEDQFVIYPNLPNKLRSSQIRSLLSIIIVKAKSNKEYKTTEIQEELRKFTEKLSELELGQKKSHNILEQICARLGNGNITPAEV